MNEYKNHTYLLDRVRWFLWSICLLVAFFLLCSTLGGCKLYEKHEQVQETTVMMRLDRFMAITNVDKHSVDCKYYGHAEEIVCSGTLNGTAVSLKCDEESCWWLM